MIMTEQASEALFRQAMAVPVSPESESIARSALHNAMAALLATPAQTRSPRVQNQLLACRLRLRALQNIVLCARSENGFAVQPCDLREPLFSLCTAADVLLAATGRTVRFTAQEIPMPALCAPRDITWLALELVRNCALHCTGGEIEVLLEASRPRKRRILTLTARCEGHLDLEALHAGVLRTGSGAAAMQRTAYLHGGALLWLEQNGISTAVFRLDSSTSERAVVRCDVPDCAQLLGDPCSVVYIGLAGVAE